jgi:N-acylneuraminate cytidylyltransferase/CMP-N,N'-diacetyllegionaminic acid synthase
MYKGKTILAVIPARGGSKGLPRKNILPLLGKPLIAWTIEQVKVSKYIDSFIVSTEDEEIAIVSREYGAEVPFMRPQEFATDSAKIIDVILHALKWIKSKGEKADLVVLLQPTSPLRTSADIDAAIEAVFDKKAKAIVSLCETEHHPLWSNLLPSDGVMKDFIREDVLNKNRQELPTYYRINGAIYIAYCDYLIEQKGFIGNETYAYLMPQQRSIDIDSIIDFYLAETAMRNAAE